MAVEYDTSKANLQMSYLLLDMGTDLKLILFLTLATAAFIYTPLLNETVIRTVLGLAMLLFIPGYSVTALLYPGKAVIGHMERFALSFGLNIILVPLIMLGLNYTPWGIHLDPLVVCLMALTTWCTLVANMRRHGLPKEERFSVPFTEACVEAKAGLFNDLSGGGRAFTIIIVVSLVIMLGVIAYVLVVPKPGEPFTEFFILGQNGTADNYPVSFRPGEQKNVTVGVVNHENHGQAYDLVVTVIDSANSTTLLADRIFLADNQTWEQPVGLRPGHNGTNMKVDFLLYKDGNTTSPYRECYL
ncbi:MAG TPA: DUF1616 domain-containing protein, partial [Methanocella sp.]|uniref:DUF1616 domain-containing protein n=1 Tax=Methanocella sp. TaxID=2052833 RepID=UPI002B79CDEB